MRQWKIVQTAPGRFIIKYKDWLLWWKVCEYSWDDKTTTKVWGRKSYAEEALKEMIKDYNFTYNRKQERKNFIPVEWKYPPNTINGKKVNEL